MASIAFLREVPTPVKEKLRRCEGLRHRVAHVKAQKTTNRCDADGNGYADADESSRVLAERMFFWFLLCVSLTVRCLQTRGCFSGSSCVFLSLLAACKREDVFWFLLCLCVFPPTLLGKRRAFLVPRRQKVA